MGEDPDEGQVSACVSAGIHVVCQVSSRVSVHGVASNKETMAAPSMQGANALNTQLQIPQSLHNLLSLTHVLTPPQSR